MGPCPPGMTIDRETNADNYEPGKCHWATNIEQANKRSNNHLVTIGGRTQTVAQWAAESGMKRSIVSDRLRRGWAPELAIIPSARRCVLGWKAKPRARAAHPERQCACGKWFTASSTRAKWCSQACSSSDYYRRHADRINHERRGSRQ